MVDNIKNGTLRVLTHVIGHDADGKGGREAVVKYNNVATTDPTVANDNTQGYSVGSQWFNSTTGILFICTSTSTGAAVWVPEGLRGGGVPSGADLLNDNYNAGTNSSALGQTYGLLPFVIEKRQAFSALGFWLVTASTAGGLARMALYTSVGGVPDALVSGSDTGDIATDTGAGTLKQGAISVTLNPGLYWALFWYNAQVVGPIVTRNAGSILARHVHVAVTAAPATPPARCFTVSSIPTFGAPPANIGAVIGNVGDIPVIALRAA